MCINLLKNAYWLYLSSLWLIIWVCPFGASAQSLNCKDAIPINCGQSINGSFNTTTTASFQCDGTWYNSYEKIYKLSSGENTSIEYKFSESLFAGFDLIIYEGNCENSSCVGKSYSSDLLANVGNGRLIKPNTDYYFVIAKSVSGVGGMDNFHFEIMCQNNTSHLCTCCTLGWDDKYSLCENFNDYAFNEPLKIGGTFTLNGGSTSIPVRSSSLGFNPLPQLKIDANQNIDFNIDRTLSEGDVARLEWIATIDEGQTAAFGIETSNASNYAFTIFCNNGQAEVYIYLNNILTKVATKAIKQSKYEGDSYTIIYRTTTNEIELWIGGQFVYKRTDFTSNKVADFNIFNHNALSSNEYYISNICYREINTSWPCTFDYQPIVINGIEYFNTCHAYKAGYSDCELSKISGAVSTESINIKVWPNPTSDFIHYTIDHGKAYDLTLYQITTGIPVKSSSLSGSGAISIYDIPKGNYMVSIKNDLNQVVYRKLISKI